MLTFCPQNKSFTFSGANSPLLLNWRSAIQVEERLHEPDEVLSAPEQNCYRLIYNSLSLVWHWRVQIIKGRLILSSRLENQGEQDIALQKVYFCIAHTPCLAQAGAEVLALGSPAQAVGQVKREVRTAGADGAILESMLKFQFYERSSKLAMQIGFISFDKCHSIVEYQPNGQGGLSDVKAYCDFAGWRLAAKSSLDCELFSLAWQGSPYQQLEDWADLVAERLKPKFQSKPALGFLGWSWSILEHEQENDEEILLGNLQAINEKLPGFGFEYLWLSLANLPGGNPGDWMQWNYKRLPGGLPNLVSKLKDLGFKMGLWCAPFYLSSALTELCQHFDEALLRNPDGSPIIVCPKWRHGDAGKLPPEQRPDIYALDLTHPLTLEFIQKVFSFYRQQGVRYFMLDFLDSSSGQLGRFTYGKHFDPAVCQGPEAYRAALKLIRQTCGPDTFLLASTGPTLHSTGYFDAVRTGNDFGEGRPIYPEAFFYPASFVINSISFWTGPGSALCNAAANYYTHRKLYLNDSGNVLTVDQPLPLEDARIHASIHAFSGASSMLGDDLRFIDPERLALIKKTLPRTEACARPMDLFDLPDQASPRWFRHRVEKPWGSWEVHVFYNLSEESMRFSLPLESKSLLWEFWNQRYLGCHEECFDFDVPAGTVRIVRVASDLEQPQLLGSDMHTAMGEMELLACDWCRESGSLSISATRPLGERGSIFIRVPEGMFIKNSNEFFIAKDAHEGCLIVRVPCDFSKNSQVAKRMLLGKMGLDDRPAKLSAEEQSKRFA